MFEWRGDKVGIFRPDVNCTNGIIHVIDRVLMVDSDVRVTADASPLRPLFIWTVLAATAARGLLY